MGAKSAKDYNPVLGRSDYDQRSSLIEDLACQTDGHIARGHAYYLFPEMGEALLGWPEELENRVDDRHGSDHEG
jgi:hypothetical protein